MSKKIFFNLIAITVISFFSMVTFAAPPLQAIFELEKNNPDHTFSAILTLKNKSDLSIKNWQFAFTFTRPITEIAEGSVVQQVGSFYKISPKKAFQSIPPKGQVVFHLRGKIGIHHYTDAPAGYFLLITNPATNAQTIKPVIGKAILTKVNFQKQNKESSFKKEQATMDRSLIIPLPFSVSPCSGAFLLQNNTAILIDHNAAEAINAAKFFADSIKSATGYYLNPKSHKPFEFPHNAIIFTKEGTDISLGKEGYILQVSHNNIIIRSNTGAGFFYAIQSLRQLLPPSIFSDTAINGVKWNVPCLTIKDYPRFAYRGLLLDVARHFIPPDQVKRLIDLMALHKLNKLQLHLTDDEGWRIEIKHYPKLTTIGAWRGFNKPLPPAFGSDDKPYGGYYSQSEMRDIIRYAKERHITIIPEIDIPGHARALLMSFGKTLVDSKDLSTYTTAQGYHDNVLSPCIEETFTVLDNIFTEIAGLFPSEVIHVGSDEVPPGVWMKSPICQSRMKLLGLKNKEDLQNYFLKRIQKMIEAKNKKMAVWDDAINNGPLNPVTYVYGWTSKNAGLKAASKGYLVILMPAEYLYFDLAYSADPLEPGSDWAGLVDTFKVYSYKPTAAKNIFGIQGALWSENINSKERLDYFAFPKLLALSEVAWTFKDHRDWKNFFERVTRLHFKRLDYYGVNFNRKNL